MSDAIVVGAGPVGLTAALVLARAGVAVTVLEAGDALAAESRASTFHPPTLEMLSELGVYNALLARGITSTDFQYRDRETGIIAILDLSVLAADTPFPFRVQCEQSKLTPILLEAFLELPGSEVVFGAAVTGVAQADGVVTVTAGERSWTADWAIGADGASSAVRKALPVEFEGMTYPERFLVVSTDEDLDALMPGISAVNYIFDPVEWLVILRTPEHWRILLPTPEETTDAAELAPERIQERLRGVLDQEWTVLHSSLYRVHQRCTTAMRVDHVLLAGDAAHVNNPLGGMGLNSGIHDAVLEAGALARVIQGAATLEELDEVCEARRDVARTYVRTVTHGNWEMAREADPQVRAAKHAELRALAATPETMRDYLLRTSMIDSLRPRTQV